MKKIILHPRNDTVTICIPEQWVGIPIICKLTPIYNHETHANEYPFEIEKESVYSNKNYR